MALTLKGIDTLVGKLNKLSNIESKKAVSEAAKDLEEAIRGEAQKFSGEQYQFIGQVAERNNGLSYFVDVGLNNDKVAFEEWKGLYYQNYGFHNEGLGGIFNGAMVTSHVMWFENAVKSAEKQALAKVKAKLQKEIREFNAN